MNCLTGRSEGERDRERKTAEGLLLLLLKESYQKKKSRKFVHKFERNFLTSSHRKWISQNEQNELLSKFFNKVCAPKDNFSIRISREVRNSFLCRCAIHRNCVDRMFSNARLLACEHCDLLGLFLKVLVTNLLTKNSRNIW